MIDNKRKKPFADRLGIFFSSLCALHCLLMPFLILSSGSVLAQFIHNEWLERGFIAVCLGIAGFSFIRFKKMHGNALPLKLFGIALVLLLSTLFIHHSTAEVLVSIAGSALLIIGHVINTRSVHYC
jgi:hypothetical protein